MKAFRPFFFILAFVLIVGLACTFGGGGSSTEQPPAAPTTQVQEQPTDVPTAQDQPTEVPPTEVLPTEVPPTEAPTAKEFFTEGFDADLSPNLWTSIVESGDKDKAIYEVVDGAFKIDLNIPSTIVKMEYLGYDYTDVRIDVSVDNRGKNTGAVLLICRASDEGWYQTQITSDQRYWIQAYDKIGLVKKGINLIANGGSKSTKPGRETNNYTFICDGNTLTLEVNGVEINRIKDTKFKFSKGHVAFGLQTVNVLPMIALFDNFKISQP
jgi:hypothetical protein